MFFVSSKGYLLIVCVGKTLRAKYDNAVYERNCHVEAHCGFTDSIAPAWDAWEKVAKDWNADFSFPKKAVNSFEVAMENATEVQVQKELGEEEMERRNEGDPLLHKTSHSTWIVIGLELEGLM